MNEELRNVFDFAIANWATLPLLPHLDRALVAAAQMQTILMDKDAIFRVHHAEPAHSQVAVVDVGGIVGLGLVQRWPAPCRGRQIESELPLTLLRKLLDSRQNPLAVSVLIRILLDVRRGLTGGKVVLGVEALRGDGRRRTPEEALVAVPEKLLTRVLARAHARVDPLQRLRPVRHVLPTNALNQLILYLIV